MNPSDFFTPPGISGGGEPQPPQITETSGYTPEQTELMKTFAERLQKQFGTYDSQLKQLMSGEASTQIDPAATQEYYQRSMYDPAMRQLQDVTLPKLRAGMGRNFWSTGRQQAEQKAIQGTQNQLSSQYGNLMYKDEQTRRNLEESAQNRMLQAMRYTPEQQALSLLQQQPIDHAVTPSNPGLITSILGDNWGSSFNK